MSDEEIQKLIETVAQKVAEKSQPHVAFSKGSIQLTGADIDLIQLCPMIAMLGVGAAFLMKKKYPKKWTEWVLGSLRGGVLGIVAGSLVATFFLGMATNATWSTPRILVLSFFMGANAKVVWESALDLSKSFIAAGQKLAGKGVAGAEN